MISDKNAADAYASVVQAKEEFVNFLTGTGDIDLVDSELYVTAQKIGRLLDQARQSLEP